MLASVRASLKNAIEQVRGSDSVQSADAEEQRQALQKYTVDLTARAEAGELDPVIGRDDEIRRTIQGAAASNEKQPCTYW
jgi:ATP-dependent Clp protease ATP-binding subunit ClpB